MHPLIRRELLRPGQLDHVHRRRVTAFLARSAFQRGLKFPDWRMARGSTGHPFAASRSRFFRLSSANTYAFNPGSPMPTVKLRVSTILDVFEQAQTELVGKAVILTDGKAGTVENVWLDELHGLRISIRGHDGKWPISTIKFAQTGLNRV
jgi:hypothetical protein